MRTIVYKFGARSPGEAPELRAQMALGRQYYNALVEAENERRKLAWGGDTVPAPPHEECKCDGCKAHWNGLRLAVHNAPLLDVKPLRTEFSAKGLYWGTYLLIEDAFARAWKDRGALKLVKFRSWTCGGVVGVQVQRSTWERNHGKTMLQVGDTEDRRTGRRARHGGRKTLSLRIGSTGNLPAWSEKIGYEQHREVEGRVTWAKMQLSYRDGREVWHVALTCTDLPGRPAGDEADRGIVAVDVGWRLADGGLRIAYARDDRGVAIQLTMGPRWLECIARADRIRSYRDLNLEAAKASWPTYLSLVRSCAGARRKIAEALTDLSEGDPPPPAEMVEWAARDLHLAQYESGCRRRSVAARTDALRKWAREIRRSYSTLVVKKTQTKKMKEAAKGDGMVPPARRQAHHAAPGEVLEYLTAVFGRDSVHIVPPAHTTNTCPECAHVNDHGAETVVACEQCGAEIDRDEVSTRNMMALWVAGECVAPTARKATARFAKRHRTEPTRVNASPTA